MSARRTSRRVLNSTVALAAAGAVALSPVLPLAQEYQPASMDPGAIRIGAAVVPMRTTTRPTSRA
jgi:uncharacterized membrane protein YbjE (DUF340 family)